MSFRSTGRHRHRAVIAVVGLVSMATLLAPACSDDGGSESEGPTSTTAANESTTEPLIPFAEGAGQLQASVDAAGTDFCALLTVFSTTPNLEPPSTTDEARVFVDLTVDLFQSVGEAAPPELATEGQSLVDAATNLRSEAEAAGYDPAAVMRPQAMQTEAVAQALMKLVTTPTSQCGGTAPGATTTVAP